MSNGFENVGPLFPPVVYKVWFPSAMFLMVLCFCGEILFREQWYSSANEALGMIDSSVISVEYLSPSEEFVITSRGGEKVIKKMREGQWEVFSRKLISDRNKGVWLLWEKVYPGKRFEGYARFISRIR
jgi:hypothetical protein